MLKIKINNEFPKYSLVSLVTFISDYLIYIMVYRLSHSIVISIFFARFLASLIQFWGNKLYVYKNKEYYLLQYLRFMAVVLLSGLLSTIINSFLVVLMPYYIAKFVAEIGIFLANFLVIRRLVFMDNTKEY